MTLLLVNCTTEGAEVVTDTLGHAADFSRSLHCSKTLLLPHADILAAISGLEDLKSHYFAMLAGGQLGSTFEEMAAVTPEALRMLAGELGHDRHADLDLDIDDCVDWSKRTGSIVHLIGPTNDGAFDGAIFRAEHDYEREPYDTLSGPVCIVQPSRPHFASAESTGWSSIEDLTALAALIRDEQMSSPPGERILIGGRLILTAVGANGAAHRVIGLFEDSDEVWDRYFDGMPIAASKWAAR